MSERVRYLVQVRFDNPRFGWTEWRLADWLPHLNRGEVAVPASFRDQGEAQRALRIMRARAARYGHRAEYRLVYETRRRVVIDWPESDVVNDDVPVPGECGDCQKGPDACTCNL